MRVARQANDPRTPLNIREKWKRSGAEGMVGTLSKREANKRSTSLLISHFKTSEGYKASLLAGSIPKDFDHSIMFGFGLGPQALAETEQKSLGFMLDSRKAAELVYEGEYEKAFNLLGKVSNDVQFCKNMNVDPVGEMFKFKRGSGEGKTLSDHMADVFNSKNVGGVELIQNLSDGNDNELYEAAEYLNRALITLEVLLELEDRIPELKRIENNEFANKKLPEGILFDIKQVKKLIHTYMSKVNPEIKTFIVSSLEGENGNSPMIRQRLVSAERSELLNSMGLTL